jgi:hypothetical protein
MRRPFSTGKICRSMLSSQMEEGQRMQIANIPEKTKQGELSGTFPHHREIDQTSQYQKMGADFHRYFSQ